MGFDILSLEPQIREILTAPGTDLSSISAKNVRTKLLGLVPTLTSAFMKEHKPEFDALIGTVFEAVSAEVAAPPAASEQESDTVKDDDFDDDEMKEEDAEEEEDAPPKKKVKKASKKELSDAELARQLSSEINARTRRSGTTNGSSSKKKQRAKKSAEMVDSDSDDEDGTTKKRKRKAATPKTGGGAAKGGFAKEYALSEPLAAVLNVSQLSRPQVVKQLWIYIKGNELQNPSNKREILCDEGLRNVFGCDKIDMFKMNKVLGIHLHENDE